eukprot:TRINITY_DN4269_c0_g1_i2.p1 TRINITY_DN4269_c0_g1~~TRINITY_DN4269_c0_g1_i2.p1  ORF type:complete len:929 (-),score=117.32 TRINITY_DN4269_c0_g1_i2:331-3117(-)
MSGKGVRLLVGVFFVFVFVLSSCVCDKVKDPSVLPDLSTRSVYSGYIPSKDGTFQISYLLLNSVKDITPPPTTTTVVVVLPNEIGESSFVLSLLPGVGPYALVRENETNSLAVNSNSLNKDHVTLFVDAAPGVGYSTTKTTSHPWSEDDYVAELAYAITKICGVQFGSTDLVLLGSHYGGKLAVLVAHLLGSHDFVSDMGGSASVPSVEALVSASAPLDLAEQMPHFGAYLQALGHIDAHQLDQVEEVQRKGVVCIEQGNSECAWNKYEEIWTMLDEYTALPNMWDIRQTRLHVTADSAYTKAAIDFLSTTDVRNAFHVTAGSGDFVYQNEDIANDLKKDFARPVELSTFKDLFKRNVRVLTLAGQMSAIMPSTSMEYYVQSIVPFRNLATNKVQWFEARAIRTTTPPMALMKMSSASNPLYAHGLIPLSSGVITGAISSSRPSAILNILTSFIDGHNKDPVPQSPESRSARLMRETGDGSVDDSGGDDQITRMMRHRRTHVECVGEGTDQQQDQQQQQQENRTKDEEQHQSRTARSPEHVSSNHLDEDDKEDWVSGYVNVDTSHGGNMFYWYFEPRNGNKAAPVVLWLQGGPACSDMIALFTELGPYSINPSTNTRERNPNSWNEEYGLLFVDQPVGTGWSYLSTKSGYVTTETQMAKELSLGIHNIYDKHSDLLANRDLYVMGESYAGKYIPALAHELLTAYDDTSQLPQIDLKGIGIGNGWTDPYHQTLRQGDFAFNAGLVDLGELDRMNVAGSLAMASVNKTRWSTAFSESDRQLNIQTAGLRCNVYDIREFSSYSDKDYEDYLNLPTTRAELGVSSSITFRACTNPPYYALGDDEMQSVAHLIPGILEKIPVLIYSGLMDSMVPYLGTEEWLNAMDWNGNKKFYSADRHVLTSADGDTVGYIKTHDNLSLFTIRNAGYVACVM